MNARPFLFSLFAFLSPPGAADAAPDAAALIEQLAAPKVRLRDEAQEALGTMPEAEPALKAAAENHPSEEARLRARRLLKDLQDNLWSQTGEFWTDPEQNAVALREVVVSPDATLLAGAHGYGTDILRTADASVVIRLKKAMAGTPGVSGVLRTAAFSPDSKWIATTDFSGQVFVHDLEGKIIHTLPAEKTTRRITVVNSSASDPFSSVGLTSPATQTRDVTTTHEVWGAAFLPDGKGLLVLSHAGLAVHSFAGEARKFLPMSDLVPAPGYTVQARAFAATPDLKYAAVGAEVVGGTDRIVLVDLSRFQKAQEWTVPVIPVSVAVAADGTEVLTGVREGTLYRCLPGEAAGRALHRIGGWITGISYAPDGHSVMVSSSQAGTPLQHLALPSGEVLWSAPQAEKGFEDVAFAGPGRIVLSCNDYLRVWTHRDFPPRKPAAD